MGFDSKQITIFYVNSKFYESVYLFVTSTNSEDDKICINSINIFDQNLSNLVSRSSFKFLLLFMMSFGKLTDFVFL